jgi:hypothetical protein
VSKKSLNSNTGVVYKTTVSGQLLDSLVLPFTQNHTLSSGFYFNNNYYFSGYIDDGNCAKILLIKTDKHFNVKETKIYHNNILEIGE